MLLFISIHQASCYSDCKALIFIFTRKKGDEEDSAYCTSHHGASFKHSPRLQPSSSWHNINFDIRREDTSSQSRKRHNKAQRLHCLLSCQSRSRKAAFRPDSSYEAMAPYAHQQDCHVVRNARCHGRISLTRCYIPRTHRIP